MIRLPAAAGRRSRARAQRAPGQGRLLGQRDQARPGTRPAGLPGLSRARRTPTSSYLACARILLEGDAPRLSAVRDAQCAHGGLRSSISRAVAAASSSSSACTGWARSCTRSSTDPAGRALPCRVYAPVGSHEELLPYLVRRLLENGANTSFVNRIVDESLPVEDVVGDPVAARRGRRQRCRTRTSRCRAAVRRRARATPPASTSRTARSSAAGGRVPHGAREAVARAADRRRRGAWTASAAIAARRRDLARVDRRGGRCRRGARRTRDRARGGAQPEWDRVPAANARAHAARRSRSARARHGPLHRRCASREAGKTVPDAIAEVREAVDFLRYYAARAEEPFGRGLRACRARPASRTALQPARPRRVRLHQPWNFPLAIFTGQVVAALAAGNAVIAKPAEQTPLIAAEMVRLLHASGIPRRGAAASCPGAARRSGRR